MHASLRQSWLTAEAECQEQHAIHPCIYLRTAEGCAPHPSGMPRLWLQGRTQRAFSFLQGTRSFCLELRPRRANCPHVDGTWGAEGRCGAAAARGGLVEAALTNQSSYSHYTTNEKRISVNQQSGNNDTTCTWRAQALALEQGQEHLR